MSRYRHAKDRDSFIARALPHVTSPKQLSAEKKAVQDLFEKYPNLKFWRALKFPFDIPSTRYFFTPRGSVWLRKKYALFTFERREPAPKPEIHEHKFGEDRVVKTKPRTLKEFLNG